MLFLNHDIPFFYKIARFHRVEVSYKSTGCFHHYSYLFKFDSKNNMVIFDCSSKKKLLGRCKISNNELKKLDLLIQYYERNVGNYSECTTTDVITIKIKFFNVLMRKYNYKDDSCEVGQQEGVMSFYSLLSQKLEKA